MLLGVVLGIVVAPLFHGREAAGLRRVPQQDIGQQGDEQGNGCREGEGADEEVQLLMGAIEPAAEPGRAVGGHRAHEGAADVMGAVPDTHHRSPLAHGEPVRHHAAARGPAHAVEPPHKGVQDAHHQDGEGLVLRADELDRDDHEAHRDGREDEAQGQEHAGVGAVRHAAHQELREGVGGRVQAQHEAELGLGEAQRGHRRDGHGQVLPHQVEAGVADEGADEYLQSEFLVLLIRLGSGLFREMGGLLQEFQHISKKCSRYLVQR